MTTRNNEQAIGQKPPRKLPAVALAAVAAILLVGGCTVYEDNHYRGRPHYNYGQSHKHFQDRHDHGRDWDRRGGWDDRRRR